MVIDGKHRTCYTTELTHEPFIEVELDRLTEVHTIRVIGDSVLPSLDISVDNQSCKLTNEGETEFSCDTFPTGKKIRFSAFGITDKQRVIKYHK